MRLAKDEIVRNWDAALLSVTRSGAPVGPNWASNKFSKAAIDAGIQKVVSHRVYRIHSH